MRILANMPWAYQLFESSDGSCYLSVDCGMVGVYERRVRISREEADGLLADPQALDRLAAEVTRLVGDRVSREPDGTLVVTVIGDIDHPRWRQLDVCGDHRWSRRTSRLEFPPGDEASQARAIAAARAAGAVFEPSAAALALVLREKGLITGVFYEELPGEGALIDVRR